MLRERVPVQLSSATGALLSIGAVVRGADCVSTGKVSSKIQDVQLNYVFRSVLCS
jgi:hypothetical protein